MPPKAAVVILNCNGESFLKQYLPTLYRYSNRPDTQLWIIDNGSTDNSIPWVEQHFPETGLIKLDKNYGFTGGYNRGLEKISAEYYIILNSDIEVTENWLDAPIAFLDKNPTVAAVAPKILSVTNRNMFEYAGAAGGFIDFLGFPFCRGRILSSIEEDKGQYNAPIPIFWASGACMFVRSSLFKELGGFDDNFFAHMEEIDLCWRLKNRGYGIYSIPHSVVYHVGGGTLPNENPKKIFLNYRNNLLLLYKNLSKNRWRKIFAIRIFFDFAALIVFFLQGKSKFASSVIKAYRDFFRMKKHYKYSRVSKYKNHPEILNRSIIIQYFFRRIRFFADLSF